MLNDEEIKALPLWSTMHLGDNIKYELYRQRVTGDLVTFLNELMRRSLQWEQLAIQRIAEESSLDVTGMIAKIASLTRENEDLRLQLSQAREQFAGQLTYPAVTLDAAALEPDDRPDGQMKYFFNIYNGPYRMADTFGERAYTWSRGPFASWDEANQAWKDYCKRQNGGE